MGAKVTFEEYAGRGHGDYPPSQTLTRWFRECGPLRQTASNFAEAEEAESDGRLGEAYGKYQGVIIPVWSPPKAAEKARRAAERLARQARDRLDAAAAALAATPFDEQQFDKGVRMLRGMARSFRGCEFGQQAARRLLAAAETAVRGKHPDKAMGVLRGLARTFGDTGIGEQARQGLKELRGDDVPQPSEDDDLNARALALEKQARQAEEAEDYLKAFSLYETYLDTFKEADRYPEVKDHVAALRADPDVRAAYRKQKAEHDCRQWFEMAQNLINAGKTDKARVYLQRIIGTYPDTEWARDAEKRLKALE